MDPKKSDAVARASARKLLNDAMQLMYDARRALDMAGDINSANKVIAASRIIGGVLEETAG